MFWHENESELCLNSKIDPDVCNSAEPTCNGSVLTSIFRPIDGVCNNKFHPRWGSQGIPFERVLNPCPRQFTTTRFCIFSQKLLTV